MTSWKVKERIFVLACRARLSLVLQMTVITGKVEWEWERDGMGVRKDEEEEEGNQKERRTSNLPTLLFPSSVFSGN